MLNLRKLLLVLLLPTFMVAGFTGCAEQQQTSTARRDDQRVSTIPWNRPERWEGGGQLGGFAEQMRSR